MSSYKTVSDVVSDLNVMITEAPVSGKVRRALADVVGELGKPETIIVNGVAMVDCSALHHDD